MRPGKRVRGGDWFPSKRYPLSLPTFQYGCVSSLAVTVTTYSSMIGLPLLSTLIWRFVKCSALSVSLNVRYSDFSIDDIALKPRIHPVNDVGVFPV